MDLAYEIANETQKFFSYIDSISDPRVKDWLLMDTFWPTLLLTLLYLLGVFWGQHLMQPYSGLELRWPLFLYNAALVWLNWNILSELFICSWKLNYNYLCQEVKYSHDPDEMRVARALWWYYMSKLIEFADTFFFVFRKKNNQISFLHLYHHASMFPLCWVMVKWMGGGISFFGPMINSFVHVCMYTYYGLAALGPAVQPYLWWKRYLTKLQLLQFLIGMVWAIQLVVFGCPHVPGWMIYVGLAFGSTLIALFLNFYYHAYLSKAPKKKLAPPKPTSVAAREKAE